MPTGRVRFAVLGFPVLLLAVALLLPACSSDTAGSSQTSSATSTTDPAPLNSFVGAYTEEGDATASLLLRPDRSYFLFVPEYNQNMSYGGHFTVNGDEVTLSGDLGPIGSLTGSGDRLTSQDGRYVFIRTP